MISYFSNSETVNLTLPLDTKQVAALQLNNGLQHVTDMLSGRSYALDVVNQQAVFQATLEPMQSLVIAL